MTHSHLAALRVAASGQCACARNERARIDDCVKCKGALPQVTLFFHLPGSRSPDHIAFESRFFNKNIPMITNQQSVRTRIAPVADAQKENFLANAKTFCDFSRKCDAKHFARAACVTHDYMIISLISANYGLFDRACANATHLCDQLSDAIALRGRTPSDILVHLPDIRLYGVFSVSKYANFVSDINDVKEEPDTCEQIDISGTRIYQIIVSDSKQKFAFIGRNERQFEILQKIASECFSTDVHTHGNQIIVNIVVRDADGAAEAHQILTNYVNQMLGQTYVDMIGKIELQCSKGVKFIEIDHAGPPKFKDSASALEWVNKVLSEVAVTQNFPAGISIFTGPVAIGAGAIAAGTVNIHRQEVTPRAVRSECDKKIDVACAWIKDHPPVNKESVDAYCDRYNAENPTNALKPKVFGRATKRGLIKTDLNRYRQAKVGDTRVWVPDV